MANGVSTSKASPTNKHSENRAHKRGFSVLWGLVTFSHAVRRVFIVPAQTHVCAFIRVLWRVFIRFLPLLPRRKACFHPSYTNARLCFHSRPQARFHAFSTHLSHAARRVFIFHAQTHVCVFTRALWRVFMRFLPTFSHAVRRVFILHTQTHVCVFTRALWRVFIRFWPTRRSRVLYSEPAPAGDSQ